MERRTHFIDNNKLEAKYKIKRIDSPHGRAYCDRDSEEADRVYFHGVTSIINNTMGKGKGYDMWLGNSLSYDHAMEYGDIGWDENSYEDSAKKAAEMLALIASTREYQFG